MRLARGLILAGSLLISGEARGADRPIPLRRGVVLNDVHHSFDLPQDQSGPRAASAGPRA